MKKLLVLIALFALVFATALSAGSWRYTRPLDRHDATTVNDTVRIAKEWHPANQGGSIIGYVEVHNISGNPAVRFYSVINGTWANLKVMGTGGTAIDSLTFASTPKGFVVGIGETAAVAPWYVVPGDSIMMIYHANGTTTGRISVHVWSRQD
jgi:hypothetical protein